MQSHTARTSQSTPHRMSNPFALMVALLITITILLPDVSVGQTKEPSTGIIAGRVYDSYSKHEIYSANVLLEPILKGTQAKAGKFALRNIPPGTYRLIVQYPHYHWEIIEHVQLSNNDSLFFNVGITPADTLTNEFYSLRLTSIQHAINMADSLAGVPMLLQPKPYDPYENDNFSVNVFYFKHDTISPKEYQYSFNKRVLGRMSNYLSEEEKRQYDSLISSWK